MMISKLSSWLFKQKQSLCKEKILQVKKNKKKKKQYVNEMLRGEMDKVYEGVVVVVV